MIPITIKEVEHLAHIMAQKFMEWNEPIPDFETRYPGILEGCLGNTFQTFDKKDLYKTLNRKAAILFYTMIKDHPFVNGNKRIAVTTMLVFLYLNGKWLSISKEDLYELSLQVASTNPRFKDGVVNTLDGLIKRYMIDRSDQED
jgi:death-on-curing family protein